MKTPPHKTNKSKTENPNKNADFMLSTSLSKRIELKKRLIIESKIVMKDSMEILLEFENLEDFQ